MHDFMAETVELLRTRPRAVTLKMMADDLHINVNWLKALLSGRITDPGIKKLTKIYDYLTEGRGSINVRKHSA